MTDKIYKIDGEHIIPDAFRQIPSRDGWRRYTVYCKTSCARCREFIPEICECPNCGERPQPPAMVHTCKCGAVLRLCYYGVTYWITSFELPVYTQNEDDTI